MAHFLALLVPFLGVFSSFFRNEANFLSLITFTLSVLVIVKFTYLQSWQKTGLLDTYCYKIPYFAVSFAISTSYSLLAIRYHKLLEWQTIDIVLKFHYNLILFILVKEVILLESAALTRVDSPFNSYRSYFVLCFYGIELLATANVISLEKSVRIVRLSTSKTWSDKIISDLPHISMKRIPSEYSKRTRKNKKTEISIFLPKFIHMI